MEKLKRVIADPEEILFAHNQLFSGGQDVNQAVIEQAKQRVAEAESQIRRLARMARLLEDDDGTEAIAEEMKNASFLKKEAASELADLLTKREAGAPVVADPGALLELSEKVAAWLDPNDPEKVKLALDGLDITVWAGAGEPRATGTLPVHATCGRNSHPDVWFTNGGFKGKYRCSIVDFARLLPVWTGRRGRVELGLTPYLKHPTSATGLVGVELMAA